MEGISRDVNWIGCHYAFHSFAAAGLQVLLIGGSMMHFQQISISLSVQILLLLLEQPQGFIILLRALTVLAARNRDYLRFSIFVLQLKHGLHTKKLHIQVAKSHDKTRDNNGAFQILVARLFNKLIASAPTPVHRALVKSEVQLAQYNPEYVEKVRTRQFETSFIIFSFLADRIPQFFIRWY